jgi:hypothetical protein
VCGGLPLGSGRQLVETSTVKLPPVISQIDRSLSCGSGPSLGGDTAQRLVDANFIVVIAEMIELAPEIVRVPERDLVE